MLKIRDKNRFFRLQEGLYASASPIFIFTYFTSRLSGEITVVAFMGIFRDKKG